MARALFKQGSCNRAAWKAAVERTTSTKRLKDKYGTSEALSKVLGAFIAWTASSSGVEQLFSKMKRSPVELASAKDDTDTRMAVVMGQDSMADQEVNFESQRLYWRTSKLGVAFFLLLPTPPLEAGAVGRALTTPRRDDAIWWGQGIVGNRPQTSSGKKTQ